jgi:hypothetical protein
MGQIIFSRNPTGSISLGLFLVAISVFLWSTLDPLFGPLAIGCIVAGLVLAVVLARRRHAPPHLDSR